MPAASYGAARADPAGEAADKPGPRAQRSPEPPAESQHEGSRSEPDCPFRGSVVRGTQIGSGTDSAVVAAGKAGCTSPTGVAVRNGRKVQWSA